MGMMEDFLKDEEGDSNLVSIIVVIVIVITVAGIFRDKLMEAVDAIFNKLTEFIG